MKNYHIYLGLVLLAFVAPLSGVASDAWADAYRDALLKEYSARRGGTDYNTLRLPAPSRSSSEFKGMGEPVFFNKDSAWEVKSYKIIGKVLPATDFMEAVTTNGLFLVVTYVVRNDSQSTDSILVSPQISDEYGNHYDAYDREALYIERVMYNTSKTIGLQQLNPRMTYTFSAIYQIPDATQAIMFNARELGSIAPDTKAIYLVDKNTSQKAATTTTKANKDSDRIAAEPGDAGAQYNLGNNYRNGTGVPKDYAEAMKWYRFAADQGYAPAQCNLGYMYESGFGVPKDYAKAVKWYQLAADQGDANAQTNLGVLYNNGTGVPKDYAEAVKWYRKAAEQGYADAQANLGYMYNNGTGVPKDSAEAVKWYRKAAEQGYAVAQYNLGLMYYNGNGVPKDLVQAHVWWNIAGAKGHENAKKNLGIVEKQMTPEQIILARELLAKTVQQ